MERKVEYRLEQCCDCPYHIVNPDYDALKFGCFEVEMNFDQEEIDAGGGFPGWCPLEIVADDTINEPYGDEDIRKSEED